MVQVFGPLQPERRDQDAVVRSRLALQFKAVKGVNQQMNNSIPPFFPLPSIFQTHTSFSLKSLKIT